MNKQIMLAVGLVLASLSAPALADGRGFIRVESGRSDVEVDVDFSANGSGSDTDSAWGVRGGYWFNPNFAVEGFYTRLYSTSFNDGFDHYRIKLHGVGAGVVGKKRFGSGDAGFFVSGRAGIARGIATLEYRGSFDDAEATSARPYFGVGAGYDISDRFGLSVNYDRLTSSSEGVDLTTRSLTLGAELRF